MVLGRLKLGELELQLLDRLGRFHSAGRYIGKQRDRRIVHVVLAVITVTRQHSWVFHTTHLNGVGVAKCPGVRPAHEGLAAVLNRDQRYDAVGLGWIITGVHVLQLVHDVFNLVAVELAINRDGRDAVLDSHIHRDRDAGNAVVEGVTAGLMQVDVLS